MSFFLQKSVVLRDLAVFTALLFLASCTEQPEVKSYKIKPEYEGPVVTWKLPNTWGENPGLSGTMAGSFHIKSPSGPIGRIGVMPFREAVSTLEITNMFGMEFGYSSFDASTIGKIVTEKEINGVTYEWVRLSERNKKVNPKSAIIAIRRNSNETWLFPFVADAQLIDKELENFVSFLESFKARSGKTEIRIAAPTIPNDNNAIDLPAWEIPSHWVKSSSSSMRLASYEVKDASGNQLDFSVTSFAGEVGSTLANLNRWLEQIGMETVTNEELGKYVSQITLDENPAQLVAAESDSKALYVAILSLEGRSWFFKISGDLPLARVEKSNFFSFLESVCFH